MSNPEPRHRAILAMPSAQSPLVQPADDRFETSGIASSRASKTVLKCSRFAFNLEALESFLQSGWMVALDHRRFIVGWGEWADSAQPVGDCALYAPDFYLESEKPWRITEFWDVLDREQFLQILHSVLAGVGDNVNQSESRLSPPLHIHWREPRIEDFTSGSWQDIQEGFRTRGLKKAVPVVFARAEGQPAISRLLLSLRNVPEGLLAYGLWHGDRKSGSQGIFGITPEVLFSQSSESGMLSTMALAGTIGKADPLAASRLSSDPKERSEHELVVQDLQDRLTGVGEVMIGSTEIFELPTLYHLLTPIQVRPDRPMGFEDWVKLLHPTPALGVAPRALGFTEMKNWDHEPRGRFGAPFGVLSPQGSHCLVAIRNIQWTPSVDATESSGGEIRLGSGCGILPESVLEREWQELSLKRNAVRKMLDL